ncbi:hypothetical protein Thiowin_00464 [Thiorhodovibrio winogradskyi]|uniref:Uncharacterized protein n=1 Tax=Thiorhodovibrio winogradskyi TaxID=77007 RepID=A0ABZ0S339_9GAMM
MSIGEQGHAQARLQFGDQALIHALSLPGRQHDQRAQTRPLGQALGNGQADQVAVQRGG